MDENRTQDEQEKRAPELSGQLTFDGANITEVTTPKEPAAGEQRQLFINEAGQIVDENGEQIKDDDPEAKKEMQAISDQVLTAWSKMQIRTKTPAELIDFYAKIKTAGGLDTIAKAIIDALPEATAKGIKAAAKTILSADPNDEKAKLILKGIAERTAHKRGNYITDNYEVQAEKQSNPIPDHLAIISRRNYENALNYTSLFKAPDNAKFDNAGHIIAEAKRIETDFDEYGNLYIVAGEEAEEVSKIKLTSAKSHEIIESINKQNLDLFFSVILSNIQEQIQEDATIINPAVAIDAYDLAEKLGTPRTKGKIAINNAINATQEFQNIVGTLQNSASKRPSEYAVLQFKKYDEHTNEITIESPYIVYLIKKLYLSAFRRSETGEIETTKDGRHLIEPIASYLIHTDIVKERDKAAIENVKIITVLIEQAGNFTPHISAVEILNRNILLSDRINNASTTSYKNRILERVFTNTWKYLKADTDLLKVYDSIKIPSATPTMQTLDIVFEFPNKGKAHTTRR